MLTPRRTSDSAVETILGLGLGVVLLGMLTWTATATLVRGRQHPRCDERIRDE